MFLIGLDNAFVKISFSFKEQGILFSHILQSLLENI